MERKAMNSDEVAELLRVSRSLVYEAARQGELPVIGWGRRLVFSTDAIARFLDQRGLPYGSARRPARDFRRPGFCGACGTPFPWVDRAELISELINQLDDEDLTPAQNLQIREELKALADPDLPAEEQQERWKRVRQLVPRVIAGSGRILERLITEAIRQQLGP